MRFNALFFTSTILFVASMDASSTKVEQHELERFLRSDTKPEKEERGIFDAMPWEIADMLLKTHVKIAKDVYTFDRRDGAEYNLLKSKDYETFYKLVGKKFSKEEGEVPLDTQVAADLAYLLHYDVFARILQAARKDPDSKYAAIKLQTGLMRSWEMEVPKRSASDLFDHLFPRTKNEKLPDDLLRNPLFELWYKYVTTVMEQSKPKPAFGTVEILEARYGKHDVVMMLEAFLKADYTKADEKQSIKLSLRVQLLNDWVREETSIKDVFDAFEIRDIAVDDLLDSPAFRVVYMYSTVYREWNPKSRFDLINAITVGGRDASVAKMLYAAKVEEVEEVEGIEKRLSWDLQNLQFEAWYVRGTALPTIKNMLGVNEDPKMADPAGAKVWKNFVWYKDLWDRNYAYEKAQAEKRRNGN